MKKTWHIRKNATPAEIQAGFPAAFYGCSCGRVLQPAAAGAYCSGCRKFYVITMTIKQWERQRMAFGCSQRKAAAK